MLERSLKRRYSIHSCWQGKNVAKVTEDIRSVCGKCGEEWHVIVAMVGSKIAKVQCKLCGKLHRHRTADGPAQRISTGKPRAAAAVKKPGMPISNTPLIEADPDRPIRSYSIKESFEVGDRITHQIFGSGVVEMQAGPGKIQVFFPQGRRVLAHQR